VLGESIGDLTGLKIANLAFLKSQQGKAAIRLARRWIPRVVLDIAFANPPPQPPTRCCEPRPGSALQLQAVRKQERVEAKERRIPADAAPPSADGVERERPHRAGARHARDRDRHWLGPGLARERHQRFNLDPQFRFLCDDLQPLRSFTVWVTPAVLPLVFRTVHSSCPRLLPTGAQLHHLGENQFACRRLRLHGMAIPGVGNCSFLVQLARCFSGPNRSWSRYAPGELLRPGLLGDAVDIQGGILGKLERAPLYCESAVLSSTGPNFFSSSRIFAPSPTAMICTLS